MKTEICLFILLLLGYYVADSKELKGEIQTPESALNVTASPDLYNLTKKWVDEYGTLNPSIKINLNKSEGDDDLLRNGAIAIIDNESWNGSNSGSWNMVIGRDIIVPLMNVNNPLKDEILIKGITPERLAMIFESPGKQNWEELIGKANDSKNIQLNCYIMDDLSVLSGVRKFLNSPDGEKWIKTGSEKEMVSALQKDPNALGFCKLIQIMDANNQNLPKDILLVPIDKNGNGKIDYMENIYENLQDFSRGVWIGKYPPALSGKIYVVATREPVNRSETAFLRWILTDGQQFLKDNGYSEIMLTERQAQLAKINEPVIDISANNTKTHAWLNPMLLALLIISVVSLSWIVLIRRQRINRRNVLKAESSLINVFDENSVNIPKGLYFDKTHTWAYMKKDGTVKIGIDDFLQHITGAITRVGMKKSGEKIRKGESLLTLNQKGKQLNIYSPVTGIIIARNDNLKTDPSLLNNAPYEDGWIYSVEPKNWILETQFLSMAEKYKMELKNEFTRLKDFFSTTVNPEILEHALIPLQDGGALRDNILADLGPEIWDDFQTKFIDVSR